MVVEEVRGCSNESQTGHETNDPPTVNSPGRHRDSSAPLLTETHFRWLPTSDNQNAIQFPHLGTSPNH